jgi:tetratricopeptide (TPR) repeat protein
MIKRHLLFLFFALTSSLALHAQEQAEAVDVNVDDLGDASSSFKENFFNALREKAIGNHDRALTFLDACAKLEPESGAVQFEMAKNHLANKAFAKAESHLQTALKFSGEREWLLDTLFEIYDQQKSYDKALPVLEKLAKINKTYQELLPSLYMRNNQDKSALEALELLGKRLGPDEQRDRIKKVLQEKIQRENAATETIDGLEQQLQLDPKKEQTYLALIYLYSQQDDKVGMLKTSIALEKNIKGSDKAHLALYKIYLDNGELSKGIKSMKTVFGSNQFDDATKVNVLRDFIDLGSTDLAIAQEATDAITLFSKQVDDPRAFDSLGDYYLKSGDNVQALAFFEKGLETNGQDFELVKKVALISLDNKDYARVITITNDAIELFPAQALLYLMNGVALNKLNQADKAILTLETGLSFILDESKIEHDMYQQLALAYTYKGDNAKASKMRAEAQKRYK